MLVVVLELLPQIHNQNNGTKYLWTIRLFSLQKARLIEDEDEDEAKLGIWINLDSDHPIAHI